MTLLEILTGTLSYDSSWAVYAEKIDGKFTPDSPARFGQTCFENGGLLDDCEIVGANDSIVDFIDEYKGPFEPWASHPDLWDSWVSQFYEEMESAEILYGGDRRDIMHWAFTNKNTEYHAAEKESAEAISTEEAAIQLIDNINEAN